MARFLEDESYADELLPASDLFMKADDSGVLKHNKRISQVVRT
ncbi:hypothetical protein ACFIOY_19320 [Bradyrhizobium sp. TZ2]